MIYILFRIRTDTTKDRPGFFMGAFIDLDRAGYEAQELNKKLEKDSSYMYVIREVDLNNPQEGLRLWKKENGY